MAISFIALMEISRTAHEDLKSSMERVKSSNEARARARQSHKKVRTDAATSQHGIQALGNSIAVVRKPMPVTTRTDIATRPLSNAQLDNPIGMTKIDAESLSEMGETESLRLQMAMDRLSKSMSTLSNLLRKTSDTASSTTKNLK